MNPTKELYRVFQNDVDSKNKIKKEHGAWTIFKVKRNIYKIWVGKPEENRSL
jgi:hypothetical protein